MQYYLPELIFSDRGAAARKLEQNIQKYNAHFEKIRPRLEPNLLELVKCRLHDLCVNSVEYRTRLNEKRQQSRNLIIRVGPIHLYFWGLKHSTADEEHVGHDWLYDEIDLTPTGDFTLSVLLTDGEFEVTARHVTFLDVPPVTEPVRHAKPKRQSRHRKRH